jgi:hypothetical protein
VADIDERGGFIARGAAPVGFRTAAANIGKGVDVVGTQLGVRGAGPTGVEGNGEREGVLGNGPIGVHGNGEDAGVLGVGQSNAPGGRFKSQPFRGAQINLLPHSAGTSATTYDVKPKQFINPSSQLPKRGNLGDLWVSTSKNQDAVPEGPAPLIATTGPSGPEFHEGAREGEVQPQCHLWLCVRASGSGRNARWSQVLLGGAFEGRHAT